MDNTALTCGACGWPAWKQERVQYDSHIKLADAQPDDSGIWHLGTAYVLKERKPKDSSIPSSESACLKFLKENTTIPVPDVPLEWIDDTGTYFQTQSRMHGQSLEDAWPTLSSAEKAQIADEVAADLAQLRQLRSPRVEAFGGSVWMSNFLTFGEKYLHEPVTTDDELFEAIVDGLDLPDRAKRNLRKRMPACGPFTLTDGDLTLPNYAVKNGHLVGKLNWETVGYYPVWWQYMRASIGHGREDEEWKAMLRQRMDSYPEADEFYKDLYALGEKLFRSRWPGMDERRERLMRELMKE